MKQQNRCAMNSTGECVPYKDFSSSGGIMFGGSSADPLSFTEISRIPVEYSDRVVIYTQEMSPLTEQLIPRTKEERAKVKKHPLFDTD